MRKNVIILVVVLSVLALACVAFAQGTKPPDTVIVKGAPMGAVKMDHKAHAAATKCEVCHHPSKPEKAATSPTQKCGDCHTKVATAPMKTKMQAAFHDPMAKTGVCVDCHKKTTGKAVPVKCADCHKKENG